MLFKFVFTGAIFLTVFNYGFCAKKELNLENQLSNSDREIIELVRTRLNSGAQSTNKDITPVNLEKNNPFIDEGSVRKDCIDEDDNKINKRPIPKTADSKHNQWKQPIENIPDVIRYITNSKHKRAIPINKLENQFNNEYPSLPNNEGLIYDYEGQDRSFKHKFDKNSHYDPLQELYDTEYKLTQIIRMTALAEELAPLLAKLDNFPLQCPYNVPSVKVGSFCYTIELHHLSFNNAKRFCSARRGTLAQEPITPEIWEDILLAYNDYDAQPMWIGATRDDGQGPFTFFNDKSLFSTDNRWATGSPTAFDNKNCLALDREEALTFIDLDCHDKLHFVCQYELTSLAQY